MSIFMRELKYRFRQIIFPIVGIGLIGYFVYHSVQGERGLISYMRIDAEIARTEIKLKKLETTRKYLEHKVSLLHPKSLDRDMLEEQAHHTLNYANPNDVIIIDP